MTLSVLAGNGQLVRAQSYSAPLTVGLQDDHGQPVANATITWSPNSSSMKSPSTVTDANGHATNEWIAPVILMGWSSWSAGSVTASVTGASVTFYLTAYYLDTRTSISSVGAKVLAPVLGQVLSGPSGGSAGGTVQVAVTGQFGNQTGKGVPNVKVSAYSDPASASALQGSVLTDANGIASFTPLLGGQPGPVSPFTVDTGGLFQFPEGLQFQVTGKAPQPVPAPVPTPAPAPAPQSVILTLADGSGKPLAGMAVYALLASGPQSIATDSTGKAVLPAGAPLLVP